MQKTLSEIRGMLTALAVVASVALFSVSVSFGLPGQELISSLRFHIAFAALLLPVLMLLTGARLRAVVMFAVIGLSLVQSATIVIEQQQRRSALADATAKTSFTLLNFNVLGNNPRGADAARYIIESGADVVVVMEAKGVSAQLPEISTVYPYRVGCAAGQKCDLVILSRTPFLSSRVTTFRSYPRPRLAQVSLMLGNQTPLTIVAAHVSKPYFDEVAQSELQEVRNLLRRIDGPLILTGDFNAAAWSNEISGLVASASLVPPPRHPATWPVELGAFGVPIDNMFSRGPVLIHSIEATPESYGSNHLGLLARIDLF